MPEERPSNYTGSSTSCLETGTCGTSSTSDQTQSSCRPERNQTLSNSPRIKTLSSSLRFNPIFQSPRPAHKNFMSWSSGTIYSKVEALNFKIFERVWNFPLSSFNFVYICRSAENYPGAVQAGLIVKIGSFALTIQCKKIHWPNY